MKILEDHGNIINKRLVRVLAILLSIVMIITSNSKVLAHGITTKETSDFQRYDLSTGKISFYSFSDVPEASSGESPGYFPNGCLKNIDADSPKGIVINDNRYLVANTTLGPFCNTVYIESTYSNGSTSKGSGFVIGPYAVATAAHCVYKDNLGYPISVKVVPAKNGTTEPYGSDTVTASNLVVSSEFIYNNNNDAHHDWAIVELNSDLGNSTGWLGLKWQITSYNGSTVHNTGYPASVNNTPDGTHMYCGVGLVQSSQTYIFIGDWDASAGNSGGPVFSYYTDLGYTAIGILTSGSDVNNDGSAYPVAYSTATRITQNLYNLFVSYRP